MSKGATFAGAARHPCPVQHRRTNAGIPKRSQAHRTGARSITDRLRRIDPEPAEGAAQEEHGGQIQRRTPAQKRVATTATSNGLRIQPICPDVFITALTAPGRVLPTSMQVPQAAPNRKLDARAK